MSRDSDPRQDRAIMERAKEILVEAGKRRFRPGECATCKRIVEESGWGAFAPAHDASPRCKSGQRPHCSCDTCF